MFGSTFLEVALGLAFVYVLLSLICSGLKEVIAQLLNLRADTLKQGVQNLITDPTVREQFYRHPLIKSLSKDTSDGAAKDLTYIPSRNFALALLDSLTAAEQAPDPSPPADVFDRLDEVVNNLPPSDLRTSLLTFLDNTEQKVDAVVNDVETWFNNVMSQASQWYKQKAQVILMVLAVAVAGALNADTIDIAASLWKNPALRASVAAAADAYVAQTDTLAEQTQAVQQIQENLQQLNQLQDLQLPLGWSADTLPRSFRAWVLKIVGLLFTAFAAAQGAPFWFDLMRKLVSRKP